MCARKTLILTVLLAMIIVPLAGLAQKKKQPTIMVMPDDAWCISHGYYKTNKDPNSGEKEKIPDYEKAFEESHNLGAVIDKIGELFADRGFPLRDMEEKMKQIQQDQQMDQAEEGGIGTKSTLKEQLLKTAKADIIIYLTWKVLEEGPYKQVDFVITAKDPYMATTIASASDVGPKNSGKAPALLKEAVLEHVTNLQSQMQEYFDDLNENGRKIRMRVKIANDAGVNMKDYCSGKEKFQIGQMFEDAVTFKAEDKAYRLEGGGTENRLTFSMIRIPMFYERESAFGDGKTKVSMNATDFAEKIKSMMADKCEKISKEQLSITGLGLGEASITITR